MHTAEWLPLNVEHTKCMTVAIDVY